MRTLQVYAIPELARLVNKQIGFSNMEHLPIILEPLVLISHLQIADLVKQNTLMARKISGFDAIFMEVLKKHNVYK